MCVLTRLTMVLEPTKSKTVTENMILEQTKTFTCLFFNSSYQRERLKPTLQNCKTFTNTGSELFTANSMIIKETKTFQKNSMLYIFIRKNLCIQTQMLPTHSQIGRLQVPSKKNF